MEKEVINKRDLIREASVIYESQGMAAFQRWARERDSTEKERAYLARLEGLLSDRNGVASTRVYSFDSQLVLTALRL